jgi:FAD/FMN-containing dehydrogenase
MRNNSLNFLKNIFDDKDIKSDELAKEKYSTDWTNTGSKNPLVIVFPRTESQIQDLLLYANEHKIEFIGSGGRTGLSGGCSALKNEIIISFEKMNKIIDYDSKNKFIICEPGVILKDIQDLAINNNTLYPIDFSSSGSCTIGGNISTNAGGIKVIKYGTTRNYVDGLDFLTGKGLKVSEINDLRKNATGPSLSNLLIGSEGVLGLITKCKMKVVNLKPNSEVALLSINNIESFQHLSKEILFNDIEAFEFINNSAIESVFKNYKFDQNITKSKYYFLIEFFNKSILNSLSDFLEKNYVEDIVISQNIKHKNQLWEYRLRISESIADDFLLKFDIAVPVENFTNLVFKLEKNLIFLAKDDLVMFGHIGDGNLHLNLKNFNNYDISLEKVKDIVYSIVLEENGTISAEHGLGSIKIKDFKKYPNHNNMQLLKGMKSTFDPNNLLNPGKLI